MDSGNSGSLQSSSGGDDEYDSRSESMSAFLLGGAFRNQQQSQSQSQQPPPSLLSSSSSSHHQHHQQQQQHQHQNPNHPTSLFDPLSNYFDVFSSRSTPPPNNPNSPINLDMAWSRGVRSEPNSNTDHVGALMGSNSSSSSHPIMFGGSGSRGDINAVVSMHQNLNPPSTSSISLPPHQSASASASASASDQPRQSKKRSRASRRAPTTVLTTDTSNFRAMVQEFTGIPAPPFSASPFSSSRLDLFNSTSTLRTGHLDPIRPPPYLLRPYAQKVQPTAFTSSTSNTSSSANNMNTSNSNSSNNFQLLSDQLGLPKQTQNLANMQNTSNPVLTFQSLLQSTIQQKFPVPSSSGAYVGENSNSSRMGALEEFNTNTEQLRTHLNELPGFVTPQGLLLRNNSIDGDQAHVRPPNDKSSDQIVVSSSGGRGGGGGGGGSGEGMVDSWICSSD